MDGDKSIHLWDLETSQKLATVEHHFPSFREPRLEYQPQWGPGGRWLFGIPNWNGDNEHIRFWEVTFPSHSYKLQSHANTLHFSPDGNLLAVNGDVWKVQTSKDQAFLSPPHKSSGADYAFVGAKGQVWYAFLPREVVDRYDPQQRKSSLQMIDAPIKLVQDSPEKRTILLPRPVNHETKNNGEKQRIPADIVRFGFSSSGSRFCVMYSIDDHFNYCKSNDLMHGMEHYDMETSKDAYKTFSRFPILNLDFQTEVWSLEDKNPKRLCKLGRVTGTFPGMRVFGGASRWLLGMQRSDRGQEHYSAISSGFSKSCFFPKDSVLFTNNESGVVVQGEGAGRFPVLGHPILDINSQKLQELQGVVVADQEFSPPENILCRLFTPRMDRGLFAGMGGRIFVAWQVGEQEDQDRRPHWKATQQTKKGGLLILEGGNSPVYKLALSNDERFLASVSQDLTLRLWDLTTGKEVLKCQPHEVEVTALAFSPDGKTLVTAGADNILKVWNLEYIHQELNALGLGW